MEKNFEMIELCLDDLASVSGGGSDGGTTAPKSDGGTNTTCPRGSIAHVEYGHDRDGGITVTVSCHD